MQYAVDSFDMNEKQAVVLLSGGLDSTTVLAIAQSQGFICNCLSFQYGQRQAVEVDRARLICKHYAVERNLVLRVDLDAIGGSALTTALEVPKDRPFSSMETEIPITYDTWWQGFGRDKLK